MTWDWAMAIKMVCVCSLASYRSGRACKQWQQSTFIPRWMAERLKAMSKAQRRLVVVVWDSPALVISYRQLSSLRRLVPRASEDCGSPGAMVLKFFVAVLHANRYILLRFFQCFLLFIYIYCVTFQSFICTKSQFVNQIVWLVANVMTSGG